jgi:nuclear pore complex protein Nup62
MYECMYATRYVRMFVLCTYICMYVGNYVRMFVLCTYMYVCTYICARMDVCTYICTRTYVCMYVCACMCVCMYVCMYVCMCVCVCMYVCNLKLNLKGLALVNATKHSKVRQCLPARTCNLCTCLPFKRKRLSIYTSKNKCLSPPRTTHQESSPYIHAS